MRWSIVVPIEKILKEIQSDLAETNRHVIWQAWRQGASCFLNIDIYSYISSDPNFRKSAQRSEGVKSMPSLECGTYKKSSLIMITRNSGLIEPKCLQSYTSCWYKNQTIFSHCEYPSTHSLVFSLPDLPIGGWPSLLNHLKNLLAVVAAGGLQPSNITTPLLLLLLLL
ncbi:hypothetical protein EAG_01369 [Camponotus floridanus]|uniref:Uncharacterized protein n=1 Tax=Camponotus floridanus TaxID=104421 RepID=E2AYW5_CAMFO|nr:hypothetical protein EAG_01369 [Camponotus floridanus]